MNVFLFLIIFFISLPHKALSMDEENNICKYFQRHNNKNGLIVNTFKLCTKNSGDKAIIVHEKELPELYTEICLDHFQNLSKSDQEGFLYAAFEILLPQKNIESLLEVVRQVITASVK